MKRNHTISRWAGIFLLAALAACQTRPADLNAGEAAANRALAGKALWEEKCRTVAGEKIYRKVANVEGLLLLKVRPQRGDREWADRMWPGAAMAQEFPDNTYIESFLLYEVGRQLPHRGHVDSTWTDLPGYRWVEVIDEKDGQRYRYTAGYDEPWKTDSSYSKSYVRFNLDKSPATGPVPRYAVTFEDHVIAEDRALGIASSTIKVLDLQTKEVLGEMTRYVWNPGSPSRASPSPWLSARKCGGEEIGSATRFFADKVLIPTKEK